MHRDEPLTMNQPVTKACPSTMSSLISSFFRIPLANSGLNLRPSKGLLSEVCLVFFYFYYHNILEKDSNSLQFFANSNNATFV